MELAAKKTKLDPASPPDDTAARDGQGAPVELVCEQQTRCLILLANHLVDPTGVLRSFRRRPVEIEIFNDGLALLAELGQSANSSLSATAAGETAATFQLPTIVLMVEPELNAETRTFMAVIRKYFPQVVLLAHTEDPSAEQLAGAVADTRDSRVVTTVATAVAVSATATALSSDSGSGGADVLTPGVESKPAVEEEVVSPPNIAEVAELDEVFAPPSFDEIGIAGKISENGGSVVRPNRLESAWGGSLDAEDEQLISEEELAMLLGNGNFILDDAEPEAGVPASQPTVTEGGLENV